MENKYILDTNIFITAKNKLYPFDLFPSFWDQLLTKAKNEEFYLTREIYEELLAGEDELTDWITENETTFAILESDEQDLLYVYSDVIQSVEDNIQYHASAKYEFADVADSWIIAHAVKNSLCIVTLETQVDVNCKKRVKIPNVCLEFDVICIDLITFMRNTNFVF